MDEQNEVELIEFRSLRKENRGYMQYIFMLRQRGEIGSYTSEAGYAAFCPKEVEAYKARVHRGRPMKKRPARQKYQTREMLAELISNIDKEERENV